MCRRICQLPTEGEWRRHFDIQTIYPMPGIAPTWTGGAKRNYVIVRSCEGKRGFSTARWGTSPPDQEKAEAGQVYIHTHVDKVRKSPVFADAFEQRRCLVPVDGWIALEETPNGRIAHYVTVGEQDEPVAMAALWTKEQDEETFVVIMRDAAKPAKWSHEPVIVSGNDTRAWLRTMTERAKVERIVAKRDHEFVSWPTV